jgi:tetratricopeptide (TPR) repeat protein
VFKQFRTQYPNSELSPRVHYNIGYILNEQGKKDEAKTVLKEVLASNYNEKDLGGRGIMGPQYALYKHFSCEQLADIYISETNYVEAEKYVRLFDKKYPYEHFCGNELTAYQIFKSRSYAKVYDGQGKTDEAIKQLIPHVFYAGLADNDELIEDLISLLDKRYKTEEIKNELKKSITTLRITESKKKGETATIDVYTFKVNVDGNRLFSFSNPDFEAITKLEGREKYLKIIRANGLFKHYGVE